MINNLGFLNFKNFSMFFIFPMLLNMYNSVALSEESSKDGISLEQKQAEIFKKMFIDPTNMDYMFDYSLVSIKLNDLEGAITTLQRMLISNPNLPRVQMELGAAFFKLGSYNSAASYFRLVKTTDGVPPEVLEKVNRFLVEIDKRTNVHRFSGSLAAGIGFKTNANSAPGSNVQILGFNSTNDTPADSDLFLENAFSITHTMDLQSLNSDVWINDISAFSLNFYDQSASDVDVISAKSGPRISLDDKDYGIKFRPTLSTEVVQSAGRMLYQSFGIGFEVQDTVSKSISLFGSIKLDHKKHKTEITQDGFYFNSVYGIGLNYFSNVTIRGTVNYSWDDVRIASLKNQKIGGAVFAAYTYSNDMGLPGYPWRLFGSLAGSAKFFDKPDSFVNSEVKRTEQEARAALGHTFNLSENISATLDVDALWRDSSLPNFEVENYGMKLTLGYRF